MEQTFNNQLNSIITENTIYPGMLISAFSEYEFCSFSGERIKKLSIDDNLKRSEYLESSLLKAGFPVFEIFYHINNNFFIDYLVFSNNKIKEFDFVKQTMNLATDMNQTSLIFLPKGSIYGWTENVEPPKIISIDNCGDKDIKKIENYFSLEYKIFDIKQLSLMLCSKKVGKKCPASEIDRMKIIHVDFSGTMSITSKFKKETDDWRESEKKKVSPFYQINHGRKHRVL